MLNSRRNVEGSLVLATNLRKVQVCRTRITSPWGLSAAGYLSSAAHAADLFRFMIICQWESQSCESLLPLIESAQQGLPQQEWLLRQGKKYVYFRPIRSLGILLRAKGKMYLVNFRSTDSITMSRWPVTMVPAIRRVWKKATSIRALKNNQALSHCR